MKLAIGDANGNIESIVFADMTITDETIRSRAQTDAFTYARLPPLNPQTTFGSSTSEPGGTAAAKMADAAPPGKTAAGKTGPAPSQATADDAAFVLQPGQPAASAVASGRAQSFLTSFIAGDELNTVAEIGADTPQTVGSNAASGVLIDPATSVTAFLSATQLAALDHDRMTIV